MWISVCSVLVCVCVLASDVAPSLSDTTGLEEQERERRRQVMEKFQKAPFEEIAAHCESKVQLVCSVNQLVGIENNQKKMRNVPMILIFSPVSHILAIYALFFKSLWTLFVVV